MFARRIRGLFKPPPAAKIRWVVVANQNEVRIFQQTEGTREVQLVAQIEHPERNTAGGSLARWSGNPMRHAADVPKAPRAAASEKFAKSIDGLLRRGRVQKTYDELVLIAEPHFLGTLLAELDRSTKRQVVESVNKDLGYWREPEIVKFIQNRLPPIANL